MADTTTGLDELIREAIASRLLDVNVCLPAIVRAYDDATETCTAEVVTMRPLETDDGDIVYESIKPIQNVPVAFSGGGAFNCKFALAPGDTVLLVFAQWSFARWRESGAVSEPGDLRMHSPAYPVAIPWWRPSGSAGSDSGEDDGSIGRPSGLRMYFGPASIGAGNRTDYVAMAAKVDAMGAALKAALSAIGAGLSALGGAPLTGASAGSVVTGVASAVVLGPTASTNLMAD